MNTATPLPLAAQRLGGGAPLLILHGLLGSGTNWRSLARRLGERREVHLLDARNHGASPHDPAMDYPAMAVDTLAYMDDQGIEAADVIGHSMGGKTAMWLALTRPERVRSLVVVDIAPAPSPGHHGPLLELMRTLPVATMQRRAEAEAAMEPDVPEASLRAFVAQNLTSGEGGGLTWRIDVESIARALPALMDFPATQRHNDGPALFLAGGASDYLTEAHRDAVHTHFPAARIERIDGAGHWLHAEQPAAFLRAATAFLDEHPA